MFYNENNPIGMPPAPAPAPSTVPAPPAVGAPTTTTPAPAPAAPAAPGTGMIDPSQSTLSASFAPYVNQMLEMGAGAAAQPYQAYEGERFAGPTDLQQQAYGGIASLGAQPQGTPTQFDTQLGPVRSVEDYMSQYTTGVSDIAAREATRQADISRQSEQARMAQAGGYGGSRQAIMEAERQRNLGTQISDIRTQGLQAAYDRANEQRLKESALGLDAQRGTEQSRQYGSDFGLRALDTQMRAGTMQQADQQKALDFGYQQFQESMQHPYKQATYMQSLLQGMPLKAPEYSSGDSALFSALTGGLSGMALYERLFGEK